MASDIDIFDYLERGGKISAPDNAPSRYRAELMRIMASFVDSELAGAAGFADLINEGPGIKERITASRIVLEKLDHAERVLKIMGDFGANTDRYMNVHPWAARVERQDDLGAERRAGDMRLNVFHYPLEGWADSVAMNVLMGRATAIQLKELAQCSYQPLAEAYLEILPREERHAALGEEGVKKIAETSDGRSQLSASFDYWLPRVAASFGGSESDRFDMLKKFGLRHTENDKLLDQWRADIDSYMQSALN